MTVRAAFLRQSKACTALGSPFMGRLMALCAERLQPDGDVARRVLDWEGDPSPSGDSVPLRLAGALHALKLESLALDVVYPPNQATDAELWAAVVEAIETHDPRLNNWLNSPPQTNEVRRSAALLPALACVYQRYRQPVALYELGASAGLNLCADLFHLRLPDRSLGAAGSPVKLTPDWNGPMPPTALPKVVTRLGVDLAPVDPFTDQGRLRLLAYLWPDQPDRLARTKAAIDLARDVSIDVTKGDAADWLESVLANPAEAHLPVVYHTVAWQYFPEATKARALAAMQATKAPLVRIGMEADGGKGAGLTLTHFPSGETQALGRADFHGRWIDWAG